jgi:3-dehydroquinate dehydratase-2
MRIIIINGPNLNLLGKRKEINYGSIKLEDLEIKIKSAFDDIEFTFYQSNHEGELIDMIQRAGNFNGLILNPGGYAHTSVAIKDALEELKIFKIEVHLSHLAKREDYRQILLTAQSCNGYISGFKEKGYLAAVYLIKAFNKEG